MRARRAGATCCSPTAQARSAAPSSGDRDVVEHIEESARRANTRCGAGTCVESLVPWYTAGDISSDDAPQSLRMKTGLQSMSTEGGRKRVSRMSITVLVCRRAAGAGGRRGRRGRRGRGRRVGAAGLHHVLRAAGARAAAGFAPAACCCLSAPCFLLSCKGSSLFLLGQWVTAGHSLLSSFCESLLFLSWSFPALHHPQPAPALVWFCGTNDAAVCRWRRARAWASAGRRRRRWRAPCGASRRSRSRPSSRACRSSCSRCCSSAAPA